MSTLHPRIQQQRETLSQRHQDFLTNNQDFQQYVTDNHLDAEEIAIEAELRNTKAVSVFDREQYIESVSYYQQSKGKSTQITMKIQQPLLSSIKVLASQKGMPYQTFVQSILHQYATGQLVSI